MDRPLHKQLPWSFTEKYQPHLPAVDDHKFTPLFTIAIDGPASSGKGTLAKGLSLILGLAHLDTGLLYRIVAYDMVTRHLDINDSESAEYAARSIFNKATWPDEHLLRTEKIGSTASGIATMPGVRDILTLYQRRFAYLPRGCATGAVLDGRDIGTVVIPDATVKFWVTASLETRARRRARQSHTAYAKVIDALRERDTREATRSVAPMIAADDAVVIDTDQLGSIQDALMRMLNAITLKDLLPRLTAHTPFLLSQGLLHPHGWNAVITGDRVSVAPYLTLVSKMGGSTMVMGWDAHRKKPDCVTVEVASAIGALLVV